MWEQLALLESNMGFHEVGQGSKYFKVHVLCSPGYIYQIADLPVVFQCSQAHGVVLIQE